MSFQWEYNCYFELSLLSPYLLSKDRTSGVGSVISKLRSTQESYQSPWSHYVGILTQWSHASETRKMITMCAAEESKLQIARSQEILKQVVRSLLVQNEVLNIIQANMPIALFLLYPHLNKYSGCLCYSKHHFTSLPSMPSPNNCL